MNWQRLGKEYKHGDLLSPCIQTLLSDNSLGIKSWQLDYIPSYPRCQFDMFDKCLPVHSPERLGPIRQESPGGLTACEQSPSPYMVQLWDAHH